MHLYDGVTHIRNFCGTTSITVISDEEIEFYVDLAEAQAFNTVGVNFFSQTVIQKYDGDDSNTIILKNYPVTLVSSLKISDVPILPANYILYKEKSMIMLTSGCFPRGYQNIEIEYEFGSPEFEDPNQFKLTQKLVLYLASKDILMSIGEKYTKGIKSEKLGNYTLTYQNYNDKLKEVNNGIDKIMESLGLKTGSMIF